MKINTSEPPVIYSYPYGRTTIRASKIVNIVIPDSAEFDITAGRFSHIFSRELVDSIGIEAIEKDLKQDNKIPGEALREEIPGDLGVKYIWTWYEIEIKDDSYVKVS